MGILSSIQNALVLTGKKPTILLIVPGFWTAAALLVVPAFAVAISVGRFGGRRALTYIGGGFIFFAALSLFASWFYSIDILFTPIALVASISAALMQVKRLRDQDRELTNNLIASSTKLDARRANDA